MTNTKICDMTDTELTAALKEIAHEELNSEELFQWFYSLTMTIYGLKPKNHPVCHWRIRKWTELADLWGTCPSKGSYNILFLAIYKLHWGTLPHRTSSNVPREMIDAVAAEILKNGDAYHGWKKSDCFRKALNRILRQTHPMGGTSTSHHFLEYLKHRTYFYVFFNGDCPPTYDFIDYNPMSHRLAVKHAVIYSKVRNYETVITKLVPEALSWDDTQWRNIDFQLQKIKDVHGIDFKGNHVAFDNLFVFLEKLWCHGELSLRALLAIKEMPDSIMNTVWPSKTKLKVTRQLRIAYLLIKAYSIRGEYYDSAPLYLTKEPVLNSWLFSRCRRWVYSNNLDGAATDIKKIVLELEMGIYT